MFRIISLILALPLHQIPLAIDGHRPLSIILALIPSIEQTVDGSPFLPAHDTSVLAVALSYLHVGGSTPTDL